jgi:DegV family protein with EDD domain
MKIRIVTDSTADLPAKIVKEQDITIVPEYLSFGDKVFRDRIDITEDEFYERLVNGPDHPKTSQPSPQDFVKYYSTLAQEADGIVSIHLSSKLSGTYSSALQGKNIVKTGCNIEVIDSRTVSIAMGFLVIQAAKMAKAGMGIKQIVHEINQMTTNVHILVLFDTLKYLAKGGRIGKGKAFLGSLLNVKPLLVVKDGELVPSSKVRTRSKGIDLLVEYVNNTKDIQDLAIVYSTTPDEARALSERIRGKFPEERTIISRLGSALGVHAGPGVLAIALRTKKPDNL